MKRVIAAMAVIALMASCGNGKKEGAKGVEAENGIAFAYYCQDSVAEHFNFFKEQGEIIDAEAKEFQAAIMKLQQEGQMRMQNLQKQQGAGILSAQQVASKERGIAKIQQQIQVLQETDGAMLEKKTMDVQNELMEKMEQYAKEYSDEHGFSILFAYQRGGQILYMDESADVTMDFIKYMNDQEGDSSDSSDEETETEK